MSIVVLISILIAINNTVLKIKVLKKTNIKNKKLCCIMTKICTCNSIFCNKYLIVFLILIQFLEALINDLIFLTWNSW